MRLCTENDLIELMSHPRLDCDAGFQWSLKLIAQKESRRRRRGAIGN